MLWLEAAIFSKYSVSFYWRRFENGMTSYNFRIDKSCLRTIYSKTCFTHGFNMYILMVRESSFEFQTMYSKWKTLLDVDIQRSTFAKAPLSGVGRCLNGKIFQRFQWGYYTIDIDPVQNFSNIFMSIILSCMCSFLDARRIMLTTLSFVCDVFINFHSLISVILLSICWWTISNWKSPNRRVWQFLGGRRKSLNFWLNRPKVNLFNPNCTEHRLWSCVSYSRV